MWTSITACAAMLFPVALAVGKATGEAVASIAKENGPEDGRRYTTALLLMLTYAASAGALATPVGTPPNLIGIGFMQQQLGLSIGFLHWMVFGVPLAALMLVTRYALVLLLFRPSIREVPGQLQSMRALQETLGPWTAGQRNSLIAFATAIVLWITPGLLSVFGPADPIGRILNDRLVPGVAALFAAALLFVLPIDWKRRKPTLEWDDAAGIDWGTVLLFGSGIALGKMMLDTGLAAVVGRALLEITGTDHPSTMIGAAIVVALIISELASNTAAATMVIPIMLSLVPDNPSLGLSIALGTTFGVSLGFMLPVSTPANAIVYGSGAIRMQDMVKAGAVVDLIGILLIWAFSIWIVPLLPLRL
jgi:sodium-dependent dicarboxylate transporter 2/3/5